MARLVRMNAIPPVRPGSPATAADLAFGGQLSLWALRLWLTADRGCPALHHTLRTGFALVRLPAAYTALDQLLSILVCGNCCVFGVSSRNSRALTGDEQQFLGFLADQQDGAVVTAYQKLADWIRPNECRQAMAISLVYATLLTDNNLKTLRPQDRDAGQPKTMSWLGAGKYH